MPALSQPAVTGGHTGRRKTSRKATPTRLANESGPLTPPKSSPVRRMEVSNPVTCIVSFDVLARDNYFCANHIHYICKDAQFGVIHCLLSLRQNKFSAHILSRAGFLSMLDTECRPSKASTHLPAHLTHDAEYQALVSAFLEYLRHMSSESPTTNLSSAWSDSSIAKLVSTFESVKNSDAIETLKGFMCTRSSKTIDVDVIVSAESEIIDFLPAPTTSKSSPADIYKYPEPAVSENVEKKENLLHEILATERTYVSRLQHLLRDYAIPLRAAARKERGLLGMYETNNIFPSTLDAIVLLNQDFLRSLEGASSDYEFAMTLLNGFRDFAKVYARYLETSSDLDQILRDSMKVQKFKEFTDQARATAGASIGIRELVMEPISRIPRYSLLITSLLTVTNEMNPAYLILREALSSVRRIGHMERDKKELSQEVIMKLASLVSSWPSNLVKSSTRVLGYVDCLDVIPPYGTNHPSNIDGCPCSLVLFADRLVILKRSQGNRIEEILQSGKKGELGYRGYALLDNIRLVEGEDCLHLLLTSEIQGVNSDRWLNRPFRRYALMSTDAGRFGAQVHSAQFESRSCEQSTRMEDFEGYRVRYAVYDVAQWASEEDGRKSAIRVWEGIDDANDHAHNLVLSQDSIEDSWSCKWRKGKRSTFICRAVSKSSLRKFLNQKAIHLQLESWLSDASLGGIARLAILGRFAQILATQRSTVSSPTRLRPTSPSKIMTSFLGRNNRENSMPSRPATAVDAVSSSPSHTIRKKKSNPLFNFGGEDRSLLGVEAFVSSLLSFDHFQLTDFASPSAAENKQINSLVSLISKDPKKTFAILGSPAKVALHALKGFCKSTLAKKLTINVILPDAVVQSLRAGSRQVLDMRLNHSKAIITALPTHNSDSLRAVLRLGNHLLTSSDRAARIKCLLFISETLVTPLSSSAFIDTLEFLLHYFQAIFLPRSADFGTTSSVTSGMSLQPSDSRFGSISSRSHSHYTNDTGNSCSPLRSPAKASSFDGTPELVYGTEGTEDGHSMTRSRSSASNEDVSEDKYKRSTIHADQRYEHDGILGLNLSHFAKSSMESPHAMMNTLQSKSSTASESPTNPRDRSLVRSLSLEPAAPFMQADARRTEGKPVGQTPPNDFSRSNDSAARRNVTPSRLPLPSPKTKTSMTFPSPQLHSSSLLENQASNTQTISSKKGSSIPRLPSTLIKRRESKGLTKSFSDHSFTFDIDAADDLNVALKYSMSAAFETTDMTLDGTTDTVADTSLRKSVSHGSLRRSDSAVDKSLEERQRRMSKEYLKRELAADSRLASTSTIRRISRQLEETDIGPLEMPLPPLPGFRHSIAHSAPSSRPSPVIETASPDQAKVESVNGCTLQCRERYEMLELELQHYKNLYRSSVEEIDMTLDVANEQIADIQSSLEKGSFEATVLAMLELEKEKNRKLVVQIGQLRDTHAST